MLLFQVVRVFQRLPRSKRWRSDASQPIDYAIPSFLKVPYRPSPSLSYSTALSGLSLAGWMTTMDKHDDYSQSLVNPC